jgi:hypothetical protein
MLKSRPAPGSSVPTMVPPPWLTTATSCTAASPVFVIRPLMPSNPSDHDTSSAGV